MVCSDETLIWNFGTICLISNTGMGMEAIEMLRFLASFPPPGTGKREGGEKMQPFNRCASHPFTCKKKLDILFGPSVRMSYTGAP